MTVASVWKKFAVGEPGTNPNFTPPECRPLPTVSHVSHVSTAIRIVEDRRLRADFVSDQSKLNTERIRVVWMSPNDWANGFRYGNVRFTFDWPGLLEGKRAYWVESIAYGVEACRILVTDKDHSSMLEPYDPSLADGPWSFSMSTGHRWNAKHCLEIMVEGDVPFTALRSVDFVKHHNSFCCVDPSACASRGVSADDAGAEFLALSSSVPEAMQL